MSLPTWPDSPGPRVLTLAGNDLTIDARARKTAKSLAEAEFSVIALGLDKSGALPRQVPFEGSLMVRVTPSINPRLSTRVTWLSPSAMVERLAHETELQRERLQMARRNLSARRVLNAGRVPAAVDLILRVVNGALRRLGASESVRSRFARSARSRSARLAARVGGVPSRLHTVSIQRRYQLTSILYRFSVRTVRRRSRRLKAWRRDLPEMHKWEAAIGPIVDHLQPDLVHCHDIFHLGLAARAKARATAEGRVMKIVYDAQEFIPGLPSDPWRRAAYASMEAEYIGQADAVITVSDSLGDLLFNSYGVRPGIVMNAPERAPVLGTTPVREVVGIDQDQQLLVFVGGLAPDRGAEVLLEAMPPLAPSVHLVFVTNAVGGYRDTLVGEAQRLGIGDRVHFAPFVDPEAVTGYIASADASIIPLSRDVINYEVALPNKLFQSIQAGVPVVVSDNPEMARFVPAYGIGTVFVGGDSTSLAAGIIEVLENREQYLARLSDEEMLAELSWEHQSEILIETYNAVGVAAE